MTSTDTDLEQAVLDALDEDISSTSSPEETPPQEDATEPPAEEAEESE